MGKVCTLSNHTFDANGRYSRSSAGQLYGKLISGEGDGRYAVRGSEITITPRVAGRHLNDFASTSTTSGTIPDGKSP